MRDALVEIERRLDAAGVDTPRVDAEWIVAHVLGARRADIFAAHEIDADKLEPLVRRRERREPLAYVLGEWGFRRLTLATDRRALVPRPETESVVERALALVEHAAEPRVLDVGVGSGAIALAIADEHPGARVTGVDTSLEALELARENADRLGLPVELRVGDIGVAAEGWDLVVANPPYVAQETLSALQPELRWEPQGALLGDGHHAAIAQAANTRWLVLEAGDGQAHDVARTLEAAGYVDVHITRDLGGTERVVEGRRT